jgi:hypothetical protein
VNRDVRPRTRGVFSHWVDQNMVAVHPLSELEALEVADDEYGRYLKRPSPSGCASPCRSDCACANERQNATRGARGDGYELLPEIVGASDHIRLIVLLRTIPAYAGDFSRWPGEKHRPRAQDLTCWRVTARAPTHTRTIPLNAEALAVLTAIRPESATASFQVANHRGRFNNVKNGLGRRDEGRGRA